MSEDDIKTSYINIKKFDSDKVKKLIDRKSEIEDMIKDKIYDTMMSYCEKGDYEGAKKFVGSCYEGLVSPGKTLLFRSILVHEKNNQ